MPWGLEYSTGTVNVNRTGAQRGWHASLGCFGDYLTQRGRGRYSFWIHTLSPPPDFELSATPSRSLRYLDRSFMF